MTASHHFDDAVRPRADVPLPAAAGAWAPRRLDIPAFARAAATLSGVEALQDYARLCEEAEEGVQDGGTYHVRWQAVGEHMARTGGPGEDWLHLTAEATLPMLCQRCLSPVDLPLDVRRSFLFARDEATAQALDEEREEDVLVTSREFDLHALLEDELLMALPIVPRHEVCPHAVTMSATDAGFEQAAQAEKTSPFAVLAGLRHGRSG